MIANYSIKTSILAASMFTALAAQGATAVDLPANPLMKAPAAPVVSPNYDMYRQLDKLRSESAILAAKLKNEELKQKLANGGEAQPGKPRDSLGGPSGNRVGAQSKVAEATITAQVQMVAGVEGQLKARLSLSNGGVVTVWVGSTIAGMGVVQAISRYEVLVANKKETISVPFAQDAANVQAGSNFAPISAMPPLAMPLPMPTMPGGPR